MMDLEDELGVSLARTVLAYAAALAVGTGVVWWLL